jgi:acetyl esterase/lipase
MKWRARAVIAVVSLGVLVSAAGGIYPLAVFNGLVPKDGGSRGVARDVAYASGERAHLRRALDVYAPVKFAGNAPVIVFFYGGSWDSGRRQDYSFAGRALAAQGFVVVVPDYRLLPEVGFPAFLQDCADAVRWTRRNATRYGGDGERIVLAGHSAGAYNAAMLALDPQWLGEDRQAVRGFAALAGPADFLPLDDPATIAAFGQWPRLDETQPVHFASADDPPALLLHGSDDTRVKPRNSRRLAAALEQAGVSAQLVEYPGLGHVGILTALAKPFRAKAPVLTDLAVFARRVTEPAAKPDAE